LALRPHRVDPAAREFERLALARRVEDALGGARARRQHEQPVAHRDVVAAVADLRVRRLHEPVDSGKDVVVESAVKVVLVAQGEARVRGQRRELRRGE
jgi:hypothetical protein